MDSVGTEGRKDCGKRRRPRPGHRWDPHRKDALGRETLRGDRARQEEAAALVLPTSRDLSCLWPREAMASSHVATAGINNDLRWKCLDGCSIYSLRATSCPSPCPQGCWHHPFLPLTCVCNV